MMLARRIKFVLVVGVVCFAVLSAGFAVREKLQNKVIDFMVDDGEIEKLGDLLVKAGYRVKLPIVMKENLIMASISGVTVIFSKERDFSSQVRALQLVLSRPTIGGKEIKEIDVRFNKAVLRFKE